MARTTVHFDVPPRECPEGHPLQPYLSHEMGMCDECEALFTVASPVWHCGLCNWVLCASCRRRPQPKARSARISSLAALRTSIVTMGLSWVNPRIWCTSMCGQNPIDQGMRHDTLRSTTSDGGRFKMTSLISTSGRTTVQTMVGTNNGNYRPSTTSDVETNMDPTPKDDAIELLAECDGEEVSEVLLGLGKLRGDRKVVLAAVRRYGLALEHASEDCRGDAEVALAAVLSHGFALEYVSVELQRNRDVVLSAIRLEGLALRFANTALRANRDICLAAIRRYHGAYAYASSTLKTDRSFALEAVKICGAALEHMGPRLQADPEVVATACESVAAAIRFGLPAAASTTSHSALALVDCPAAATACASHPLPSTSNAEAGNEEVDRFSVASNYTWATSFVRNSRITTETFSEEDPQSPTDEPEEELTEQQREWIEAVRSCSGPTPAAQMKSLLPKDAWEDRSLVLAAVAVSAVALKFASRRLRADREVVLTAIRQNGFWGLQNASRKLQEDRALVLEAVSSRPDIIGRDWFPQAMLGDKEVILRAINGGFGHALQRADPSLKADREVVAAAVARNGQALLDADDGLQGERSLLFLAVVAEHGPRRLQDLPPGFCEDRSFLFEAVLAKPELLVEAGNGTLCDDRSFVMDVVTRNGLALRWASEALRDDREVVLKAAQSQVEGALRHVFEHASEALQKDPELLRLRSEERSRGVVPVDMAKFLEGLDKRQLQWFQEVATAPSPSDAFSDLPANARADRALALAVVCVEAACVCSCPTQLLADRELMLAACMSEGLVLQFAADELRADRALVLAAVKCHGGAYAFAAEDLRRDPAVLLEAMQATAGPRSLAEAPEGLRRDRACVLEVIRRFGGHALEGAAEEVLDDRGVVLEAVCSCGPALRFASRFLRSDFFVVYAAVAKDPKALDFALPPVCDDTLILAEAARERMLD